MVGFDANFALLIWRTDVPASVPKAKERVAHLVNQLHEQQERIVIATPVLSELLIRAHSAGPEYLTAITKSMRFKVADYDTRAAVEVAAMIRSALRRGNKRDGSKDTWAKVNFDRQIAAICKVEQAHTIYTDDEGLKNFAEKMGIKVVGMADLPIPPSNTPLFDDLPDEEITPVPEPPNERDTDERTESANPPQLREHTESRAGDTSRAEAEEKSKGESA